MSLSERPRLSRRKAFMRVRCLTGERRLRLAVLELETGGYAREGPEIETADGDLEAARANRVLRCQFNGLGAPGDIDLHAPLEINIAGKHRMKPPGTWWHIRHAAALRIQPHFNRLFAFHPIALKFFEALSGARLEKVFVPHRDTVDWRDLHRNIAWRSFEIRGRQQNDLNRGRRGGFDRSTTGHLSIDQPTGA